VVVGSGILGVGYEYKLWMDYGKVPLCGFIRVLALFDGGVYICVYSEWLIGYIPVGFAELLVATPICPVDVPALLKIRWCWVIFPVLLVVSDYTKALNILEVELIGRLPLLAPGVRALVVPRYGLSQAVFWIANGICSFIELRGTKLHRLFGVVTQVGSVVVVDWLEARLEGSWNSGISMMTAAIRSTVAHGKFEYNSTTNLR
jgi:hypothetical protein